ncbi:fatty acyl-CoA reductase 1-like [Augochlora pura]
MNKTLKRFADKMSLDKISEPSSQAAGMNVSEIAEFYKGQNVLLIGGTGFIGLLIIEKLMRSCPDIANLYMLIRPNIQAIQVFSRVKEEQPGFLTLSLRQCAPPE